ncbi:MAG TPA: galactokinase family protein [Gammaproteobacteria bacterium]|nr:galactokinase family protein [Gammaproteobacteria bacterium]
MRNTPHPQQSLPRTCCGAAASPTRGEAKALEHLFIQERSSWERQKAVAFESNFLAREHHMKIFAPGKLILSGEHAVIHGSPALAMAINRYTTVTITREMLPQILFDLSDLAHQGGLSLRALRAVKARLKHKYQRFIRGDFSIRQVLQKPFELAQFALSLFVESLNLTLPHGVKIHLQSDIPIGCGLGSSAATILSVMHAVSIYLQIPISTEKLFQLALEAENMQHGRSSGLDLRVALQGGCLYHDAAASQPTQTRPIPAFPFYLVNTGTPITTTGECIENVAAYFQDRQLTAAFTHATQAMDHALTQQSPTEMQAAIRDNHQLLTRIGVVPQKVQTFIRNIEAHGGAAKICGAGAVRGEQAGAILVLIEDQTLLTTLSHSFHYNLFPIAGETRGVHAA